MFPICKHSVLLYNCFRGFYIVLQMFGILSSKILYCWTFTDPFNLELLQLASPLNRHSLLAAQHREQTSPFIQVLLDVPNSLRAGNILTPSFIQACLDKQGSSRIRDINLRKNINNKSLGPEHSCFRTAVSAIQVSGVLGSKCYPHVWQCHRHHSKIEGLK